MIVFHHRALMMSHRMEHQSVEHKSIFAYNIGQVVELVNTLCKFGYSLLAAVAAAAAAEIVPIMMQEVAKMHQVQWLMHSILLQLILLIRQIFHLLMI